ncbi:MAG: hypothetical protein K2M34_01200 [Alphaproteobacteria bacterium]|nr:hypothetical protein [Alphaproteobacteria bacterium]
MSKCPHNQSIECDQKSRDDEFVRQLNIVIRSGAFWFPDVNQSPDCRAKCSMCWRLAHCRQH